ncbi:MAG: cation transporter [Myxococcales bacterium]|nr:cation transporter [Myxococcales bacterium]
MSEAPRDRQTRRVDPVRRALRLSLVLNGAYMLIELGVGFYSGSLALLSDAAHMFSDSAALLLALVVAELARRPASPGRSFGLLRAEVLGAFTNALLLLGACALIVVHAIERLASEPPPFPAVPVLVVAVIGLGVNLGSAWLLARADRQNLNVRAALAHMLADALGSVGAIAAALLAWRWGLHLADSVISLLLAALIGVSAWRVLRDAAYALMDFAPPESDPARVRTALEGIDGVAAVHELHLWGMGGQTVLTAHLVAAPGIAGHDLLRAAEALLDELGIRHSTLQIDDQGRAPCRQLHCPLFRERAEAGAHAHHHHHGHAH